MINENIASIFWELISQGHNSAPLNGKNVIAISDRQTVETLLKKFSGFQQELYKRGYLQEGLLEMDRAAIVTEAAIKFKLYYSKAGADKKMEFNVMHDLEYRKSDERAGCILDSHVCFISQKTTSDLMDNIRRFHAYNAADGPVPTINEAYEMTLLIAPEMPTLKQTMGEIPTSSSASKIIRKGKGKGPRH